MRRLLSFLIFLSCIVLGVYLNQLSRHREVFRQICDLTADHFFREDERLERWVRECNKRAAQVSPFLNNDRLLGQIQDMMNMMEISHFQIYNPDEDRSLWKGVTIDTGIRSRYVDDYLVVYKVLPGSAAENLVRPGDLILNIEGAEQITPWGAWHRSGTFTLKRDGREIKAVLAAKSFAMDLNPKFTRLNASTAMVEIPSFRSEFFEREAWRKFVLQFAGFSHLIVDLRENAGGNFAAMLRALSTFQCGGRNVGTLLQPRKDLPDKPALEDDTSDDYQIQQLDRFRGLGLVTFDDYGCFRGKVTVLISDETSSVSEIFAHSFLARPNSRVWGQPTAGDVVLAVWYDLPLLGKGFSVSVPEAVYMTPAKQMLEGKGIWPQKELYYDLKQSLAGKDSWIEAAKLGSPQ